MLLHLTKTFQIRELNFSQINPAIKRALFNIFNKKALFKPLKRLKKNLYGRLSLCEKDISITEEMEIKRKTNRYAESIVENIAQRFPHKSVTLLNAFEIFNLELFSTTISSTQFICFGLSVIKILATNYKIDELVLKKEWCSFRFELKEFKKLNGKSLSKMLSQLG